MTSRERIRRTLEFKSVDRTPKDLGGMGSTGISAFAYASLIEHLGLPERLPRVYDSWQMLALPDLDVLNALDCDVVYVNIEGITNAFTQMERWKPYDFNGRLNSLVMNPGIFSLSEEGTLVKYAGTPREQRMPSSSFFFDDSHGGQPLDLSMDPLLEDLNVLEAELKKDLLEKPDIERITSICREVRESTDRAVFFNGLSAEPSYRGGLARWSMVMLMFPEHAHEVHELVTRYSIENYSRLMPEIENYVDVLMISGIDQGTQNATIISPETYGEFFSPYYCRINKALADLSPRVFRYLHSCGAIYDIIDDIIESGFQVLNPVQWTAGKPTLRDWKDKCRGRIALWGGGVDTQSLLTYGSMKEIAAQVREVTAILKEDGGYVFCAIHNLLAEVTGNKVGLLYSNVQ